MLDPPVKADMSAVLTDGNKETCLALGNADFYAFDAGTSRWSSEPQEKCWRPGLTIRTSVTACHKTPFKVTVTGQHLTCSTSHLEVAMRQTKWSSKCGFAGEFHRCKWNDVIESGSLITCVATCHCDGNDCRHVTINIPKKHEDWKICEIEIE